VHKLTRVCLCFISLLVIHLQVYCAARGYPEGGPKDVIPPQIIKTMPLPDSTGIRKLSKVELTFSERMDDGSVNQAVFISPLLKYKAGWSGWDKLILQVTDTLGSNVTYVVTVGSAAKDRQNNRMKESYQLAFSTGTHIDRANISGQVYGMSKQDVLYVYAYKLTAGDTLDPLIQYADYLTQPGESGLYMLNYLAPGPYRILVIEDLNKNLLFDLNYERIGIPATDVNLDSGSSTMTNLNFTLSKVDTTPPFITGARALNNRSVLLRCSETLRSFSSDQILICDSLHTDTLQIEALTANKDDHKQFFIYTEAQPKKTTYYLSLPVIVDSCGNVQHNPQVTTFSTSEQIDTTGFRMPKVAPPDSASKLSLSSAVTLEFSLPVDTTNLSRAFSIQDEQNNKLAGKWIWENLKKGFFTIDGGFKPGQSYRFQVLTRELRSVWGDTLADSTITRTIYTLSADEFGSLSGRYNSEKPLPYNVFLDILSVRDRKKVKRVQLNADNTFQADLLTEGFYQLSGFIDLNKDGEYSTGSFFPFQFAEPFYMQTDTIRVRKRWETENIQFIIPGAQ
jgi:hypothetical protein